MTVKGWISRIENLNVHSRVLIAIAGKPKIVMFSPQLGQASPDISSDLIMSLIGVAAATLTTSSFLPQIIKAYRTKSMQDVSSYLMSFFATGTVLWMVYGIFKADWVIISANATATSFNVALLYMKFAFRKKPARIA